MKIDWYELRQQKATLLRLIKTTVFNQGVEQDLEGVIHLLDAIQDCAVNTGEATEQEVFGDIEK